MLSGRSRTTERVRAMELGADAYLCKPFAYAEVHSHIRALLRRASGRDRTARVRVGALEIDPGARMAWLGGRPVRLTSTEFALLRALAVAPTTVRTKATWPGRSGASTGGRRAARWTRTSAACGRSCGRRTRRSSTTRGGSATGSSTIRLAAGAGPPARVRRGRALMVVLLLICALIALPPAAATLTTLAALAVAALLGCATRRLRRRAARTAHEVRQPLTTGLLALHAAARRGEVPPRVVASLELELRRAAYALADPSQTAPADVDLHDLLSAQARTWREVAAAHGATLTLEPGPGTPVVHADTLRLAQATSNVLANAIEHGGGRITIRTLAIGDRIRIEVTDGGPGLPASIAELSRRPRGPHGHGLSIATSALRHTHGHLHPTPPASPSTSPPKPPDDAHRRHARRPAP